MDGGGRTSLTAGAGATYLLNRNVRLDLDYHFMQGSGFTTVTGGNGVNGGTPAVSRNFQSNLLQCTVHLGF